MGRVASEGYDQARKAKDGGIRALKIGFVKMGKKVNLDCRSPDMITLVILSTM